VDGSYRPCPLTRYKDTTLNENITSASHFETPARPFWLPLLEFSGLAVWTFCWVTFIYRAYHGVSLGITTIVLTILLGIIVSDFMSGFLHWFFDTFLEITTPIIGPHLVGPFREHHVDPLAMTRHGFLESAGNSCLGFWPLFILVWIFGPAAPQSAGGTFGYWFLLSFSFALTATNQLHAWAHDPAPPRIARWLQALRLAVTAEQHAPHHIAPHTRRYCVTTGWINNFADGTGLFRYLERFFVFLGVPLKAPDSK
jgi:hypothetical protein